MAQIQKVIITDYPDGSRVMSNIRNKKGIPFFKENDTYTATRVVTWFDGSPMDDSKVDGKIYLKHRQSGDYYLVNLPNWGETFLQKPNVASLRNMSSTEILLLRMGYYKGVNLLGYYAENGGDTPAPIEYYLSNTVEEDDGGSVFEVGGIKLEHIFKESINTIYFGLNDSGILTPLQVRDTIQNTINAGSRYKVTEVIINSGDYTTQEPSINYNIPNSTLRFDGILRLKDNDSVAGALTGCRIIGYTANNIKVVNQRLDGNRDNQVHNTQVGTQFTFTGYGYNNLVFEGGWCINSIQSHCQFTAKNVYFKDYHMENSGEHGIYFSLTVGGATPGELLQLDDCSIIDNGHISGGASITTRAVRKGIYNNCIFDNGSTPKGGQCTHLNIYYAYRGSILSEGEEFKHIANNCTFKKATDGSTVFSVTGRGSTETADPLSVYDHMKLGRGIYINGGSTDYRNNTGVVSIENMVIKYDYGNLVTHNELPMRMVGCKVYNFYRFQPAPNPNDLEFINNTFYNSDYEYTGNVIPFDNNFQTDTTTEHSWTFINNVFIGFKNQNSFGIIRNSLPTNQNLKLVLDGNKLIDCDNAILAYVGNNPDVVLINNSDITNSGVRFRFTEDAVPKLVANNDFIKEEGAMADRPAANYRYVGQKFYFTTTNSLQRWNGTSWERINYPIDATTSAKGLVNQAASITNITTPDATDEATAIALANANKTKIIEMLAKLRTAGIIAT